MKNKVFTYPELIRQQKHIPAYEFDELAGIYEYDAGLSRIDAERRAFFELIDKYGIGEK